ncbi:MAG: PIG-L family deacetylase [Proteobacteria bacterium]|nr:PIG-L family deacetylase [Pseudomonadota bacterium]
MKLRLFGRPGLAVALLGLAALLFWAIVVDIGWPWGLLAVPFALFYAALFAVSAWALLRLGSLERWADWKKQRLLILAPHEDDCVIAAGGVGPRNRELGGTTRIVYLAPDDDPAMAARRAGETRAAWRQAGFADSDLEHLDLLPRLRQRDPQKLRAAGIALRAIIDEFRPSAIIMPMFEGGHIQHDMLAGLVGRIVKPDEPIEIFEAPEYSPFTSLAFTPHRVLTLTTRWLFGLVSYCGPPDGIDGRPVLKFRLTPQELDRKRRMLGAFVSQNAPSLVETRAYPDRLVRWNRNTLRRHPFDIRGSYLALALAARRALPAALANRLLPGEPGTIGREPALTDWDAEYGAQ